MQHAAARPTQDLATQGASPVRKPSPRTERAVRLGNQALLRRLGAGSGAGESVARRRPGLMIGSASDPLEHAADRAADRVMRMATSPPLAAASACPCTQCESGAAAATLRPKQDGSARAGGEAPALVHDVLRSQGEPLPPATRAFFEPRFGADFSGVRVHADATAAQSAHAVGALAYTVGRHVAFAAGRYLPGAESGRRLLAHELAHVVQQDGGGAEPAHLRRYAEEVDDAVENDEVYEEWMGRGEEGTPEQQEALRQMGQGNPPPPAYHDVGAHTNWGDAAERRGRQVETWQHQRELERPLMILSPGGEPPDFVTEGSPASTMSGEISQVRYTPRFFHVLDAIDHDVALATSPDELYGLYFAYLPEAMMVGLPEQYRAPNGKTYRPRLPPGAAIGRVYPDLSTGEDSSGAIRRAAFKAALAKRARARRTEMQQAALQEAETTTLRGHGGARKQGPCNAKHTSPRGDNARHDAYARHVAVQKKYGDVKDELTWTTPEGVSYSFDTYNPADQNQVWEVKTQHEWASPVGMATAPYRVKDWQGRIAGLEAQRLRGLYVANRCGLNFKYAVDNCPLFQGLTLAWVMIPPIEYIAYENEVRVPCPPGGDYSQ